MAKRKAQAIATAAPTRKSRRQSGKDVTTSAPAGPGDGRTRTSAAPNDANEPDSWQEAAKNSHKANEQATQVTERPRQYWLMKAEPDSRIENGLDVKFSIDDLQAATSPEPWDGVRNHVAKNNMKAMKNGDLAFFYHSNCKVPGVVGVMEIAEEASVDISAFDSKHPYYDPKSSRDKPRWFCVKVRFHSKFPDMITLKSLQEIRKEDKGLQEMQLLRQSRLSVSKVSKEEWEYINGLVEKQKDG